MGFDRRQNGKEPKGNIGRYDEASWAGSIACLLCYCLLLACCMRAAGALKEEEKGKRGRERGYC